MMLLIAAAHLLLQLLQIFPSNAEESKIRFLNGSNKPIKDPQLETARRWNTGSNDKCMSVGSTAGTLLSKILIKEGILVEDVERHDSLTLVDIEILVEMAVNDSIKDLAFDTKCPKYIIEQAARQACLESLYRTQKRTDVFGRLRTKNVNTFPSFLFNEESSLAFNRNPWGYIQKLTKKVPKNVLTLIQQKHNNTHSSQQAATAVAAADEEQNVKETFGSKLQFKSSNLCTDYYYSTITGIVIASHISKQLAALGELKRESVHEGIDLTLLLTEVVSKLFYENAASHLPFIPKKSIYKVSNVAIKISLFWLVNNLQLAKKLNIDSLTNTAMQNVGVGNDKMTKIETNNNAIDSEQVFVLLPKLGGSKKKMVRKILSGISCETIKAEIKEKVQSKIPDISSDIVHMVFEPVNTNKDITAASTADSNESSDVSVGLIPEPQQWYRAKAQGDGQKLDVTITGVLAAIVGSHAAAILPKFGLITAGDEPGYIGLETIDIYEIIHEITMKLTVKLMKVIPFSLNTGFHIVTGAFKASKFALNLKDLPNDFGRGKSNMYMPLAFKKFGLMKIFPELQQMELNLIPLPRENKPLRLWVKAFYDTHVRVQIQERIEVIVEQEISDILKDVVDIFKLKIQDLTLYNISEIQKRMDKYTTWDPPNILSFIYEPPSSDGILDVVKRIRKTPKRPLQCPGHYLCADDLKDTIPLYSCTSLDPWCYFPNNVTCPSDIHCPVELKVNGKQIICPGDQSCPVLNVECPGRPECPDQVTVCPGNPTCPLEIKCPGKGCPQRFTTQSQFLLPCPHHPQCNQQPVANQLVCSTAMSCTYPQINLQQALQNLEQRVLHAIENKNLTVNVQTKAITSILITNNQTSEENQALTVNAETVATSNTVIGDSPGKDTKSSAEGGDKKTGATIIDHERKDPVINNTDEAKAEEGKGKVQKNLKSNDNFRGSSLENNQEKTGHKASQPQKTKNENKVDSEHGKGATSSAAAAAAASSKKTNGGSSSVSATAAASSTEERQGKSISSSAAAAASATFTSSEEMRKKGRAPGLNSAENMQKESSKEKSKELEVNPHVKKRGAVAATSHAKKSPSKQNTSDSILIIPSQGIGGLEYKDYY